MVVLALGTSSSQHAAPPLPADSGVLAPYAYGPRQMLLWIPRGRLQARYPITPAPTMVRPEPLGHATLSVQGHLAHKDQSQLGTCSSMCLGPYMVFLREGAISYAGSTSVVGMQGSSCLTGCRICLKSACFRARTFCVHTSLSPSAPLPHQATHVA
jgi:hypothetical protein